MSLLDSPATEANGPGTTNTALLIRFPDDTVVPVGIQVGHTAREYLSAYTQDPDYTAVGVRQNGTEEAL